jgi:hypothetical protein
MAFLGTGYLYNWGTGNSGENFIPSEITGSFISGVLGVGNTFNVAQISALPVQTTSITPPLYPQGKFGFIIYNSNSRISPFNKIELFSSFSGLKPGNFTSGEDFVGKLIVATNAGGFGVRNNRAFVSLGKTLGTGSGIYTYPQDTFISIKKDNLRYKDYDSWSGDYSLFSGNQFTGIYVNNNFIPFSGVDGGAVIRDIGSNKLSLYEVQYGTLTPIQSGKLIRQKILFKDLNIEYPTYDVVTPVDNKSWTSYDINTGMVNDTKNVFSYAFQFVDIVTTRDSGIIITSGDSEDNPFQYLNLLEPPSVTSGIDTSFSNYIGYCFSRSECPGSEPIEDVYECFTGSSITGKEYQEFVSGVLKKYTSQEYINEVGAASDLVISSGVTINNLFSYQTGEIYFNNFLTGDRVVFNLYNFDYTGLYRSYHLNNEPLYPSTGFELYYPQDFSDIDTLVNKLNDNLEDVNYQVWYPYECLSGEANSIYITGRLMSFEKFTGSGAAIPSDKNYNNIISYRSLRNYERGFGFYLDLINREEYTNDLYSQSFKKGFSYLLPDVVELQGLTGDRWLILDRRSGLYKQLTGLESTKIPLNANPDLFLLSGSTYLNSDNITGEAVTPIETGIEEVFFSGGFRTLQRFKQTTFNSAPPYCSIKTLERDIYIVEPTGWPASINPCLGDFEIEEDGEGESQPEEKDENKLELFLNVKRTGWLLEPTGQYLSCVTAPDGNPSKIQFSGYRIVMKNFSGIAPTGENIYLKPLPEVYITNINLFSLEDAPIPVHTGKSECLIGSKYTLDIADIVAIPFGYDFEYTINSESQTGLFNAFNYPIVYPLRSFYITGNPVIVLNASSPGGSNLFTTGAFVGSTRQLSSGSLFNITVINALSGPWTKGKTATWQCSGNNFNNWSGFQLYYNNTGYFSGTATGDGGLGTGILYTGYLPRDADWVRVVTFTTGDPLRVSFTGWSGYYDLPEVKFVRESGKLIGDITGLVNGSFPGSGNISHIFGDKYFYNPAESKVYFREDVSGSFFRSGILSGTYNIIKDYVINQELFLGGRLSAEPLYHEKISNGLVTGLLTGISYFKPDTEGLFLLTGEITGLSKSGFYNYTGVFVTGSGEYIDENNFPYYPVYTGVIQSQGTVDIDFNKIRNFDIFNLNNRTVTYNTNSGTFFAPDYFSNIDILLNTINTNVDIFYATGQKINSTGLRITALEEFAPGISGNLITLTGNGTGFNFSSSTLTGGQTFFPRLFPTTIFSGFADGSIASTGFYISSGSGSITGIIPTFTGTRSFTGVWDIKTGTNVLLSFLGNNFISGENYKNSGTFSEIYNNFQIKIFYENNLNTDNSDPIDVAQIKIKDNNFSLLNNPPSGENGEFIFRITGLRTL